MASQYEGEKGEKLLGQNGLNGLQMVQFECPINETTLPHQLLKLGELPFVIISPEAGSQKRVWICMDLYGSVKMSMDLQNLGPSKKYKMLISSCVCRNYDSASC